MFHGRDVETVGGNDAKKQTNKKSILLCSFEITFLFTFYPWTDNVTSRLLAHTHKHSLMHEHLDKLKLE